MKLNNEQYSDFVEKLADEILEGQFEKEAGIGNVLKGKNIKDAAKKIKINKERLSSVGEGVAAFKSNQNIASAKKTLAKEIGKTTGAYAGIGAGAVGAGVAAKAIQKKKEEKNLEEKAAELYDYAMRKIAACEEMYADAVNDQEACIEVLAEAGLYDENGLDKEAAESSEEALEFATEVSGIYDDSLNKIAAAQESYAEAVEDLNDAAEVLQHFGYEF